jgi:hypothetical protein
MVVWIFSDGLLEGLYGLIRIAIFANTFRTVGLASQLLAVRFYDKIKAALAHN